MKLGCSGFVIFFSQLLLNKLALLPYVYSRGGNVGKKKRSTEGIELKTDP